MPRPRYTPPPLAGRAASESKSESGAAVAASESASTHQCINAFRKSSVLFSDCLRAFLWGADDVWHWTLLAFFMMNSVLQFAISIGHSKEIYGDKELIYAKAELSSVYQKNLEPHKIFKMGLHYVCQCYLSFAYCFRHTTCIPVYFLVLIYSDIIFTFIY